jgi:hypothetical protein
MGPIGERGNDMISHNSELVSCAECGFLIAFVPRGESKEDRNCDPDRLRQLDSSKNADNGIFEKGYNISSGWSCRYIDPSKPTSRSINPTWHDVLEIRCARRVWTVPINRPSPGLEELVYDDESETAARSAVEKIHKKRHCPHFFKYISGLSSMEHLEEQRDAKLMEHEEELAQKTRFINWIAIVVSIAALTLSVIAPLLITERITIESPVIVVEPTSPTATTIEPTETPVFTPAATSGTQEVGG